MAQHKKTVTERKEKKDYTFRRQFNEKLSILAGCPGQNNSDKYFLKYCVVKHSSARAQRPVTMTISISQSTQLLC